MFGLKSAGDVSGIGMQSSTVTTSSYTNTFRVGSQTSTYNYSSQTTTPVGFNISSNGGYMFICVQNSNIQIYDLSTAWDITTASNVGNWNWTQGRTTQPQVTTM